MAPPATATVNPAILRAIESATPIGPIPPNYEHFDLLCEKACIARRIVRRGDEKYYQWNIVFDTKLQPSRRKTPTGRVVIDFSRMHRAATGHTKFQAILDYVIFRGEEAMEQASIGGRLARLNILNVVLGKDEGLRLPDGSMMDLSEDLAKLEKMDWRDVLNHCATMGMKDYVHVTVNEAPEPAETPPAKQGKLKF